jgi:RNA polymerase sigma factor FliA
MTKQPSSAKSQSKHALRGAKSARKDILMPTPKKTAHKQPASPANSARPTRSEPIRAAAPKAALPAKKRVPIGAASRASNDAALPRSRSVAKRPPAKSGAADGAAGKAAAKPTQKANQKPAQKPPSKPTPKLQPKSRALSIGNSGGKPKAAAAPPPPPPEELITTEELWTAYRVEVTDSKGEDTMGLQELRNQLMERHLPLVRYIAERLLQTLPKSIELDDLISAGMFGLMDAIRGFDQSRGIKFKTYCSTRIRGAILDQLRSQDWVPRLVRLKATRIERAYQKLQGEFGREPTHAELAAELTMGHDELQGEIEEARPKSMYSLSEKWEDGEDDGSLEKVEVLVDRTAIDPVHELNRRDLMLFLTKSLSDKERFIISMYYEKGLTMREIGELLALTESRVCQIHSNVMNRLKDHLEKREEGLLP